MAISITGNPMPDGGKSRIWSTVLQVFLAGGFTQIIDAVGADLSSSMQVYWTGLITVLMSYAMAYADAHGISYPGQKRLGRGGVSE